MLQRNSNEQQQRLLEDYVVCTEGSAARPSPDEKEQQHPDIEETGSLERAWKYLDLVAVLRRLLPVMLIGLIPSFVRPSESGSKRKLHKTSFLDGLRGVAAFFVFIHHFILDWYPKLSVGWKAHPSDYYFFQLPFIRIIYSGRGMVAIFFVISGYVLSYKPLRLIRNGQFPSLLDNLASSVFRRGLRLYLPLVASTFISMLLAAAGLYIHDPLARNTLPPKQPSFWLQILDWWNSLSVLMSPFLLVNGNNLYSPPYDGHLWTIPLEYRGSIIIFVTLLGISRVTSTARLCLLIFLPIYCIYTTHWDLFLFLSGTLLAELTHFHTAYLSLPTHSLNTTSPKTTGKLSLPVRILSYVMLFISLHILCYPDEFAEVSPTFGLYRYLSPTSFVLLPWGVQRFWLSIGAVILVSALLINPSFQRPFTTRFAQYLGDISYALYMVHGPILYTLTLSFLVGAGSKAMSPTAFNVIFLGASIVTVPVTFWIADVFWRGVDAKAVLFARWLSLKVWIVD
jgi:peptidoglycan/LPS O-acetylase OafA/YrhL